jgi:hypothetical protein
MGMCTHLENSRINSVFRCKLQMSQVSKRADFLDQIAKVRKNESDRAAVLAQLALQSSQLYDRVKKDEAESAALLAQLDKRVRALESSGSTSVGTGARARTALTLVPSRRQGKKTKSFLKF